MTRSSAAAAIAIVDEATIAAFVSRFEEDRGQEPPEPFHLFRCDVAEIARTTVENDLLVVESWREGDGVKRVERT